MRIAFALALAVVGALANCHAPPSAGSLDALVVEAVIADPHFTEWTRCGDARYALDAMSAPPAYENQKPFFFTSSELGLNTPERLGPELLESLRRRNAAERPLPLLRNRAARAPRRPGDRRVWLSLPGYDATGGAAAVAVTRNSVAECPAAGYIVLLRRAATKWIVQHRTNEWVE